jgi:rhamnose utilization protein RhaD (predicted bifunctional aldolase and dehydrogenase)
MTITAELVRRLLDADPDAQLVVLEGRALVLPAADVAGERYRGALRVVSRAELLDRIGDPNPSAERLEEVAEGLETAVTTMGG